VVSQLAVEKTISPYSHLPRKCHHCLRLWKSTENLQLS